MVHMGNTSAFNPKHITFKFPTHFQTTVWACRKSAHIVPAMSAWKKMAHNWTGDVHSRDNGEVVSYLVVLPRMSSFLGLIVNGMQRSSHIQHSLNYILGACRATIQKQPHTKATSASSANLAPKRLPSTTKGLPKSPMMLSMDRLLVANDIQTHLS